MSPVDYFRDIVLPAVYERLDLVFPEFGFVRTSRGAWVAMGNAEGGHGPLGTRPDRVFVRLLKDGTCPAGFGVHGGEPVSFCAWVLGSEYGHPKGQEFLRAAGIIAARAGVEPGPLEGGEVNAQDMARARARLEAQHRQSLALERRRRAENIKKARALWERSAEGHEAVASYLRGRGIDVGAIPGGVPRSLRFCADAECGKKRLPAVVACVALHGRDAECGDAERVVAVHRIFLNDAHDGKDGRLAKPKLALGPITGGAVRMGMPAPGGVLVLTEGIETAAAIRAAAGCAVWACISAHGLRAIALPPRIAADGVRVVVAGDFDDPFVRDDAGRTPLRGQRAAMQAAERLADLFPGLHAGVALPRDWVPAEWRGAA